jgi:peptide/nickel transport system ATP-binding protein
MTEDMLHVEKMSKVFDISAPLLNRIIERRPKQSLKAVDDISFNVPRGSTFSLVGESGCGKSTVARLAVGLYTPSSGTLHYAPSRHGDKLRHQMIFQDPYASLNPRWRVGEIIAEPIRTMGLRDGESVIRRRIDELLELVGLSSSDGGNFPHEFSGGQRQRISIARALASEAEFLVCDEPTSALDVSVQAQILNLMKNLQRELDLTYLFISHDLSVVRHMSDVIAVMYLGRIVEEAPTDELFAQPRHPYTRMLLETIPDLEDPKRDRELVVAEVPSPLDPPSGCAFHPRCPLATDHCKVVRPEIRQRTDFVRTACHAND